MFSFSETLPITRVSGSCLNAVLHRPTHYPMNGALLGKLLA